MSGEFGQIRQFVAAEALAQGSAQSKRRAILIAMAAIYWLADETGEHAVELAYRLIDDILLAGID